MDTPTHSPARAWWRQPYVAPIFVRETFMTRLSRASSAHLFDAPSHFQPQSAETLAYAIERFDAQDKRGAAGC